MHILPYTVSSLDYLTLFPSGASGKASACKCRRLQVPSLGLEVALMQAMATHISILAWEIPWTEEPSRVQSTGSQKVRQDLTTKQQQKNP